MRSIAHTLWHAPRNLVILCITGYQHTLSPDHGPLKHLFDHGYCQHTPTCSEYAKQKLRERGFLIGSMLMTKRILSCHPFKKLSDEKILKIVERNELQKVSK